MINVQPYIDKLELLKEYMDYKFDKNSLWGMEWYTNLPVCEDSFYLKQGLPIPIPIIKIIRTPTFEEYCNEKN